MSSKSNRQRNKKGKSSGSGYSSGGHASPNGELSDTAGSFSRVVDEEAVQSASPVEVESPVEEPKSVYNAMINEVETESPVAATPDAKFTVEVDSIPTDSCADDKGWYQTICGCCGARK